MLGLVLTGLIVVITEYFTGMYGPVKYVAKASTTGHGTNIIAGLAISMISTVLPVIVLAVSIMIGYGLGGGFSRWQGAPEPVCTELPSPLCPCFP